MDNVLSIILGGGQGTRLYPLTKHRAKPAIPLAGKYRLIDIPVSNCINSGIHQIFVLTQFNSASLNQHIGKTYRFSPFSRGFVEVLAAQQTQDSPDWFQGTADAVRKTLWVLEPWKVSEYLILSGDHLYKMDYGPFVGHHRRTNADVTISVIPVQEKFASSFGLMKVDESGKIVNFKEKPQGDELRTMQVDTQIFGIDPQSAKDAPYIASMGIYIFKRKALIDLLRRHPQHNDFGKHVIPTAIKELNVQAFPFRGYWEDIGTIESFYQANIDLVASSNPNFSFYDAELPIFTRPRFLPPTKVLASKIRESMICDGCIIRSSEIVNSIVGIRMSMSEGSVIKNTLLMGADYYESEEDRKTNLAQGLPPIGIGVNSVIRNAIIDKNARIGNNVQIVNRNNIQNVERESEGYWIRSGIVTVIKGSVIPDNTVI